MAFADAYRGKRVLLTGHTGFKGAWLAEWLLGLGAEVTGQALPPPTSPALFDQLGLARRLRHQLVDVRALDATCALVREVRPDFVFHLAAQPLVRASYAEPAETFATNVQGTVNVLEAVRRAGHACTFVAITTDKCYENREWLHSYREDDPLGGHDPYSASKGAAELAISAYRRSFFSGASSVVRVASARAGNVIGGGDWAVDRIVPDCMRALAAGQPIAIRNPRSTRPWQHVLEPLGGYLWLGAQLAQAREPAALASAFNFGPAVTANQPVSALVAEILRHWPGTSEDRSDPHAVHEAKLLNLAIDKAHHLLGWRPVWGFADTVARTVDWYRAVARDPAAAADLTRRQIADYTAAAQAHELAWSR